MSVVSMRAARGGRPLGTKRRWNQDEAVHLQERNGITSMIWGSRCSTRYEDVKQMSREGLSLRRHEEQAKSVKEEAERAGTFFVNQRWLAAR